MRDIDKDHKITYDPNAPWPKFWTITKWSPALAERGISHLPHSVVIADNHEEAVAMGQKALGSIFFSAEEQLTNPHKKSSIAAGVGR
jgi:hypothetical protein